MIYFYFVNFFTGLLTDVFSWVPKVTQLPFGIDSFLISAVGYVNSFLTVFWIFQPIWNCFLFYVFFRSIAIAMRLALAERSPV